MRSYVVSSGSSTAGKSDHLYVLETSRGNEDQSPMEEQMVRDSLRRPPTAMIIHWCCDKPNYFVLTVNVVEDDMK